MICMCLRNTEVSAKTLHPNRMQTLGADAQSEERAISPELPKPASDV